MTNLEKQTILDMRRNGDTYKQISQELNIPINTLKVFCNRVKNADIKNFFCKHCNIKLGNSPQAKVRKFCSDKCRMAHYYQTHKAVGK